MVALVEPGGDEQISRASTSSASRSTCATPTASTTACADARFIFHLAALYRFWAKRPQDFYDINVGGTLNVLEAARRGSCERVIYTSTVGVLGLDGAAHGRPADETMLRRRRAPVRPLQADEVCGRTRSAPRRRARCPGFSLVLPTFPLGPGDTRPTPTGKLVLEFLNGRVPAFVDTTLNVVHVDDLAAGHLLALERGAVGRSYIIGGENMGMGSFLAALAACTDLPAPQDPGPAWRRPRRGRALAARRGPAAPTRAQRCARIGTHVDHQHDVQRSESADELGYAPAPRRGSTDSARWFVDNGYINEKRTQRIRFPDRPRVEQ